MPEFSKEDFLNPEVAQRLSVIIMSRMDKNVLLSFSKLTPKDKKHFNKLMNEYIVSLGIDWKQKVEADFNEVCQDELFSSENYFKAETIDVPVGESEVVLTDQQRQFEEDMKDPEKYAEWLEKLKADIIESEQKMKDRELEAQKDTPITDLA